jgi:NADP-dependent 3-hydroxy acid dehydrogenase YdfG
MTSNNQRLAIVTGATSGIGEATARKLCQDGIRVIGNGRSRDRLRALEQELGEAFVGVAGDITDSAIIQSLFEAAQHHFQAVPDIVIANAGRGLGGTVTATDVTDFERVLKLNVTSTLELLQVAANQMLQQPKVPFPEAALDIIVIGSVVGRNISPFSAVYGATKFAVHALTEGLRREVGPKGIRVSLVEPGLLLSGFQAGAGYSESLVDGFKEKFGPLLVGEDIANTIAFMVNLPPHVHVSEIMVRPTRQDYP